MNKDLSIDLTTVHSKKNNKDYPCVKVSIGDWSGLVFTKTKFEYDYVRSILESK